MAQHIEIWIDRIVLSGFEKADANKIHGAVLKHLTGLLLEKGIPESYIKEAHFRKLEGGPIDGADLQTPEKTGIGIANSLFQTFQ